MTGPDGKARFLGPRHAWVAVGASEAYEQAAEQEPRRAGFAAVIEPIATKFGLK